MDAIDREDHELSKQGDKVAYYNIRDAFNDTVSFALAYHSFVAFSIMERYSFIACL